MRFFRTFELTLLKLRKKSFIVFFEQLFVVKTLRILIVNVVFFNLRLYELSLKLLCNLKNDSRFSILFSISNQKNKTLFIRYVSATKALLISRI